MSEFVRLGQHITIAKGKPPTQIPFGGPGATEYLSPEYLRGRVEAQFAKPGRDAVAVADGDAILLWDGSNAGEFFSGRAGLAASTMALIRADESFHRGYLVHALKHLEPRLKSQTSGTGIPHVDRQVLEGFNVFRPAALEQARIAQILDALDTAIRQTEAIIEKLKQVKQGLLHDLMTRGIDANGELRPPQSQAPHLYKESPLGWIPESWSTKSLQDIAFVLDPQPDHRTPSEMREGAPYVGIGDFDELGQLDFANCRKVVWSALAKQERSFSLNDGDIIYGKIGTIGMPKLLSKARVALTANVLLIQPRSRSNYVFHYLQTDVFERQLKYIINTTSQPALGIETMRLMKLAVPTDDELKTIAVRLDSLDRRSKVEMSEMIKLRKTKSGLMDDLLTGRVRVTSLLQEEAA